ncbi:MAG: asparagine synthase (glutamine-hydrolyzing) [Saprospiraceae bacterium]|jgi:asparagine synthase (glutamine-hydrolysing)|nr:asparagine synthase (glutamine-hydrolyzing) [Saprospiraceae bacterium]MBP9209173.1 asparagine synthase (glutamine-hydrolyzing) [Saprospiraceae bacterium]MBV6472949.1 Asparagine synthetase [glutamine-hydrolyzing] 1 [Saprospiraceae bacterium]
MCGICGFTGAHEAALRAMLDHLQHRGPDHEGRYLGNYSIGMRRLSIIDIEQGNQPIWNEDKTIAVVLNGEIYNYRKLREQLQMRGHIFRTESDTEVLVHLYEDFGSDFAGQLEGMFAFCLLDTRSNSLLLARDRFGEKPLYYWHKNNHFAFSSELRALLEFPGIPRVLDLGGLQELLTFGYTLHPNTLFQGIKELSPGQWAIFDGSNLSIHNYFRIEYPMDPRQWTETEALNQTSVALQASVERQMASDVPIGSYLSGGIDSGLISAIMQSHSPRPIDTFNVRFEEAGFDESPQARKVAKHLGSRHHEITVPNQQYDEGIFQEIILHTGQPFVDSSSIPSYLLAREVSRHVKVALSGDGGDELFGGYRDFRWGILVDKLRAWSPVFRKAALHLLRALPDNVQFMADPLRGIRKSLEYSMLTPAEFSYRLYELFDPKELSRLLSLQDTRYKSPTIPTPFHQWSTIRQLMWFRTRYIMPGDMLVKVDRMSMRHSLEIRAPFLDSTLFALSASFPDRMLVRGKQTKWILRQLANQWLPPEIAQMPKRGFSLPLHKYLNEDFFSQAMHLLERDHPFYKIFDRRQVLEFVQHRRGQQHSTTGLSIYKSSHQLWLIVQLFAWSDLMHVELPAGLGSRDVSIP